jgi:hypothetical protein
MLDPETWIQLDKFEYEVVDSICRVYSGEVLWDDGVSTDRAQAGDRALDEALTGGYCPKLLELAPRLRAEGRKRAQLPPDRGACAGGPLRLESPSCDPDIVPDPAPQTLPPRGWRRHLVPEPLVDDRGVVHDYMLGVGYRPRTHFGVEVRDTSIDGIPSRAPSIGPPQPARMPGGPVITGLNAHLYNRVAPRSPMA